MNQRSSGRTPAPFSREFGFTLWGRIEKATPKITGQRIAAALNRADAYVSDRKRGKSSWTVDDVDVIAGLLGTNGLDLISDVLREMNSGGTVTPIRPKPSDPAPSVPRVALTDDEPAGAPED